MGVRFLCPNCHCVLLIARRKAGTEIQCPKCSQQQTVPAESDPLALAAHPPGSSHAEAGKSTVVDAEGMIVHWIEGDDASVDDVRVFATPAHGRHPGPAEIAPAASPPSPPAPPPPRAVSSELGPVPFEEVPPVVAPPVSPPVLPPVSPPVVRERAAEDLPSSRVWLVLLTLVVFAAAVAGAFVAGYMLGRQSAASPTHPAPAAAPHGGYS